MIILGNYQFSANSADLDDRSGVATFVMGDLKAEIPLSDSKYFFQLVDLFNESNKLAKINTFNLLKEKLDIYIQEIKHLDF